MATAKVTITVDTAQLAEIRALVNAGQAASISGFVQHAIRTALHDAQGWRELLDAALESTGGPLTPSEKAWADSILFPKSRKKRPAKGRAA
ncbi:MAG: hypothetical protein SFV54_04230 [Bryobacteraceae bacterium]|nr:hypothetical protein [Bryobacteraceae bacterium]